MILYFNKAGEAIAGAFSEDVVIADTLSTENGYYINKWIKQYGF